MRNGRRHLQAAQIRALEPDAIVGGRGLERERNLVAGMKTDSGAGNSTTKGSLRLQGDLSNGAWEAIDRPAKRLPAMIDYDMSC